jgi:hypothetical protein
MRLPFWLSAKWVVALGTLGLVLVLAFLANSWMRSERAAEGKGDSVDVPKRASNGVVKLGEQLAEFHGIKDEPAKAVQWVPRVAVYGRVVPNPQATIEIRSPFAGTLRANPESSWPVSGRRVDARQVLGFVDIRVGPQERLDIQAKLNEARLKQEGAEEHVRIYQEKVARLQKASVSEAVSRRDLDDALVALAEARTQFATAKAGVELWQNALKVIERGNERPNSTWSEPVEVPTAGEVAELTARPGMAIEAGGLIARVVDFQRPLVRLDLPLEHLTAGPPAQVDLSVPQNTPPTFGIRDQSVPHSKAVGILIGPAPQLDIASQMMGYWYEVRLVPDLVAAVPGKAPANTTSAPAVAWRPGLFVKVSLKPPGVKPQEAVSVARTAVLFHQGRALVYVRISPGRYERREVQVIGQEDERWVLGNGVTAGEPVVWRQAQILLSEEFRGDVDND